MSFNFLTVLLYGTNVHINRCMHYEFTMMMMMMMTMIMMITWPNVSIFNVYYSYSSRILNA